MSDSHLHAIFLPLHLQGHINPSIHLAFKLASRGFTITFLNFDFVHQKLIEARQATQPGIETNDDIRYHIMSDGLPADFDRSSKNSEAFVEWFLDGGLYAHVEKVVGEIVLKSHPKVSVLIADTFYCWSSKIAKKFGLFHASFWTEPALVFNLYYHLHLLKEHGHFDRPDNCKDPIDYIPGVQSIEPRYLMSYLQDTDTSTIMHKLIHAAFQDVRNADCVLCNTLEDFEIESVSALQSLLPSYPIGPIFQCSQDKKIGPTSFWAESSCSDWLGQKALGSVLYVSFGSLASFTKNELLEFAYGLMLSNVNFVWALRPRIVLEEGDNPLPVEFEEEVRGRGIVVPWTNQVAVLSHPAVGGFLTHCGWNSILESAWFEVPMLCYPQFTDQITNVKLVVDDWKIGINLSDQKPIRREDIAARITLFMSQKSKDELAKNIKDVRKMMDLALGAGGSSEKNIDLFITKIKEGSTTQ